jgi:hypothetical protein
MPGFDIVITQHYCIIAHIFHHSAEKVLPSRFVLKIEIVGLICPLEMVTIIDKEYRFLTIFTPLLVHISIDIRKGVIPYICSVHIGGGVNIYIVLLLTARGE